MSMKNGGETRAAEVTEPKIPYTTKPQFPPGKARLIVESSPECVQGFNKATHISTKHPGECPINTKLLLIKKEPWLPSA